MPASELLSLIDTINKLEKLNATELNNLLESMRTSMSTKYQVMSIIEFRDIINLLVNLKNKGFINEISEKLQEFDCYDLDKEVYGIARSLSIVRDYGSNQLILHILTNRKYFTPQDATTHKYKKHFPIVCLGKGSFKTVKICLALELKSEVFVITPVARATVKIYNFIGSDNLKDIIDLKTSLSSLKNIDSILAVLSKWSLNYYSLYNNLNNIYEEVKISKKMYDSPVVNQLALGIPFIKQKQDGRTMLLTHVFSKKSDGDLSTIQVQAYEPIIQQMLQSVFEIHNSLIIHRDIKPNNMLWTIVNGNVDIKLIDFGASVDFEKNKKNTLSLLHKLRFTNSNEDGLVDGMLLDSSDVSYALLMLENINIPESDYCCSEPSLKLIINRLFKYLDQQPNIDYMRFHSTFGFDAPEVFADIGADYFANTNKYASLGRDVYKKLSDTAREHIFLRIDYKQDVWALGISIIFLYYKIIPSLSDKDIIAFIESNKLLSKMMHPDPKLRCSIKEALEIYSDEPIIVMPKFLDHDSLYNRYLKKVEKYNKLLEDSYINFKSLCCHIEQCREKIINQLEFLVLDEFFCSLKTLIGMHVYKKNIRLRSELLESLLPIIFLNLADFYSIFGEYDTNKVLLLILNANINISRFDLACITHVVVNKCSSNDLMDAVATLINNCYPSLDLALTVNGVCIWDEVLSTVDNIGSNKCALLARYIQAVAVKTPEYFIDSMIRNRLEIFPQYAAMFILDQNLHFAIKIATGKNMLEHIAEKPSLSEICQDSICFSSALKHNIKYDLSCWPSNQYIFEQQLAMMVINTLKQKCSKVNIFYYLLILKCFVPRFYLISNFAAEFKDAMIKLRQQCSDINPIVAFLNKAIPEIKDERHQDFKQYAEELLYITNTPQFLKCNFHS